MEEMTLYAWAEAYVRHRDLFEKKIASIEQEENHLIIKNKDATAVICIPVETLNDSALGAVAKANKALLVTRNLKANLNFLIKNWEWFVKHQGIKIVFANVKAHEKWVIVPSSHAAIADPESLALGLQAMFDTVLEG